AMKQPGYITGETLVNTEDTANVLVISTWRNEKDWDAWDTCEIRQKITQQVKPLLTKPYTVRTYRYYLTKENRVWSTF
ncbi:MAG: antibiotic biosynthesis monooxygenase, partial [bacterium]|nr:antibiotic biosynthesis monooxygenase [bacterium]